MSGHDRLMVLSQVIIDQNDHRLGAIVDQCCGHQSAGGRGRVGNCLLQTVYMSKLAFERTITPYEYTKFT